MIATMPSLDQLNDALDHMTAKIAAVTEASSAEERAIAALDAYEFSRSTFGPAIASARRQAVRELRAQGYSLAEAAQLLGVTDSRIAQITGG